MQWHFSLKLKCNLCNYVDVKQEKVNNSNVIINKFESCQLSEGSIRRGVGGVRTGV